MEGNARKPSNRREGNLARGRASRRLVGVAQPIENLSHPEFMAALEGGLLTDDEIVDRIGAYQRIIGPTERIELFAAITRAKGTPVPRRIANALRGLDDLPPLP